MEMLWIYECIIQSIEYRACHKDWHIINTGFIHFSMFSSFPFDHSKRVLSITYEYLHIILKKDYQNKSHVTKELNVCRGNDRRFQKLFNDIGSIILIFSRCLDFVTFFFMRWSHHRGIRKLWNSSEGRNILWK